MLKDISKYNFYGRSQFVRLRGKYTHQCTHCAVEWCRNTSRIDHLDRAGYSFIYLFHYLSYICIYYIYHIACSGAATVAGSIT